MFDIVLMRICANSLPAMADSLTLFLRSIFISNGTCKYMWTFFVAIMGYIYQIYKIKKATGMDILSRCASLSVCTSSKSYGPYGEIKFIACTSCIVFAIVIVSFLQKNNFCFVFNSLCLEIL